MELSISVIIADRPYRLKVQKSQEELIRKAATMINNTMKELSGTYHYKDRQDLLAMSALQFATSDLLGEAHRAGDNQDIYTLIDELEALVSQHS